MRIPCQRLTRSADKKLLVIASNAHLQVADLGTGQIISTISSDQNSSNRTKGSHSALIRLMAIHQQKIESTGQTRSLLFSTGEDKVLNTWELPELKLLQSRELSKRATALLISPNGKNIVIGDKSGDIYNLPMEGSENLVFASDPDEEVKEITPEKTPKDQPTKPTITLAPIGGHVSILTSLTFIPIQPIPLLVSADRDEHIRLSRYPHAWSIESFLLGHQRFVGALLWVPDNSGKTGVLLSGGGDDDIYVWDVKEAKLKQKISVKGLSAGLKVQPEKEAWFIKSRKNQKRQQNKVENGEAKVGLKDETKCDPVTTDTSSKPVESQALVTSSEPGTEKKPISPEMCINKMICTSGAKVDDERFVIISSAGSSVVAVLSVSSILPPNGDDPVEVRYHDFNLPVLDIVDTSNHELLVSVDQSHKTEQKSEPNSSLRGLVIDQDQISESQTIIPDLDHLNSECSIEESSTNPMPTSTTLYPELLLFHKGPQPFDREDGQDHDTSGPPFAKKNKQEPHQNGKGKKKEGRMLSNQRVGDLLQSKAV
ncbi:WD40-repeat-containing domain protein [Melampsora americana]|nr:WD40-repeat-containing domain protein [Melampsora americana]